MPLIAPPSQPPRLRYCSAPALAKIDQCRLKP
jgi:hypothetical protein